MMKKHKHQARAWLVKLLKLAVRLAWLLYSGDAL
jgi:hypothetical protein